MTDVTKVEGQAIACLSCGRAESITPQSDRLPSGKWPAWEPGLQPFPCPYCDAETVWATEPTLWPIEPRVQEPAQ